MTKSIKQTELRSLHHGDSASTADLPATALGLFRVDDAHHHGNAPTCSNSVLRLESEGILYRNPKPGYRAESACVPNIVPISESEILCFYRVGQAFYSHDGRIAQLRSTDGGSSWGPDGTVWNPKDDPRPYSYTAPHGTRLRDGTILLVAWRLDVSNTDQELFNSSTGGMCATEKVILRSVDNGRTWSAPHVLDLPGDNASDLPSQVIELNDGRLFLACETWKSWNDPRPLHIKGFAVYSKDGGYTWGDRSDFPSALDAAKMYSHTRYTRMLDGRILGFHWTQSIGGQVDYDLHLVYSDDNGENWTLPQPTGIPAQTCWAADLGDGIIALAYTQRKGANPGVNIVLSEDDGRTWDVEHQVRVWDAVAQEFIGVEHVPMYPRSHENIAFGKPNLARLSDGTLVCSWWCTQACVTHARFAKLRLVGSVIGNPLFS